MFADGACGGGGEKVFGGYVKTNGSEVRLRSAVRLARDEAADSPSSTPYYYSVLSTGIIFAVIGKTCPRCCHVSHGRIKGHSTTSLSL